MAALDALFLHVPRFDGERREVMVLPLGLPALVNRLDDDERSAGIVHLGIERDLDPAFSLRRLLHTFQPRLVLLSLHWNQQTRPLLDVARRVREWRPDATIVLGGLTASVFHRELVASLPFVDAVVRGDGEGPLLALVRAVLDGRGTLADVPNLTWRDAAGGVRENPHAWTLDAATAAALRHGSLALLRHRDVYLERALYADFSEGADGSRHRRAVFLNAGRGCPRSCATCGGAAESQRLTCARDGVVLYPVDKLVRDVQDAVGEGAGVLRTCFDPPGSRPHSAAWFAALRAQGLPLRLLYDFWYLPSRNFLAELARTFEAGSVAVFSPECGSEAVRFRVRGFPFTNRRLLRAIRETEDAGLTAHCFFSAGLPTESPADVDETARLIERIRRETAAAVSVAPMFVDPASPLSLDPARWGVRLVRRTLRDFYEERGLPGGPGYETAHFDERGILAAVDRLLGVAGLPPLRPAPGA